VDELNDNGRSPVSGETRLAAVIGDPVRHSLSPCLMNAAFAETGLDWTCVAMEVPEGQASGALDGMRAMGIGGLSVTMPHKAAVASGVDDLTAGARALGAVNCIVPDGDRLVGHNTDGAGFLDGLRHDSGLDVTGLRCVVLGAGGAARAVVHALGLAGAADVAVANRTAGRALRVAELAGAAGHALEPSSVGGAVAGADLVVNATSLGMAGSEAGHPVDPDLVAAGAVVVDLIYHPAQSAWLAALRGRGVEAHNGLSMLVHQAAHAFTLWTGVEAPVAAMDAAARAALARR
jgi:shikimate dehydrogenase|tara:strand:- start:7722 stop:8594 length:873 start_codon:yes stop_codon:yes gene_type:complete